jgi:membrane-bound lytic murein transglycosylase F
VRSGRLKDRSRRRALPLLLALCAGQPQAVLPADIEGTAAPAPAPHTGDLPRISTTGRLRVLYPVTSETRGGTVDIGQALLEDFAAANGFEAAWIGVEEPAQLVAFLLAGHGDVINGGLPLDQQHHPGLRASLPWRTASYVAVSHSDAEIAGVADLVNRSVAVSGESPIWGVMSRLSDGFAQIGLVTVPGHVEHAITLEQVAAGVFDVAVAPHRLAGPLVERDPRLRIAFELVPAHPVAWQTRAGNPLLREALNEHLRREGLARYERAADAADLPEIRQRRLLRVIALHDSDGFFLDGGEPAGFEYEVVKRFAALEGLQLEVLMAPDEAQMLDWLKRGYGDLIASRVAARVALDPQIAASRVFHFVAPAVIARDDHVGVRNVADLVDRDVAVLPGSIHQRLLEALAADGRRIGLIEAPAAATPVDLIRMVGDGAIELAAIDSQYLLNARARRYAVRALFSLGNDYPHRWLVRSDHRSLLDAADRFLQESFRTEFYNAVYRRYFEQGDGPRNDDAEIISPYDDIVRKYADRYDFDWRLVTAVMYVESRFDAAAISDAGARGLMQLMPRTAREMGFRELSGPEDAIHAGIRYMQVLRERFDAELPIADRTWFAIAAYNAGFERVEAARRLARESGLDPNRWFDNTELVILETFPAGEDRRARCRCGATAAFVREVRTHYDAYVQMLESVRLAAREATLPGGGS